MNSNQKTNVNTKGFKFGHVALIGEPNVGKSTLLNSFVGERVAMVTPKPQTTRHRIMGICHHPSAQIVFLDSPGYHLSDKRLNQLLCQVSDQVMVDANLVCLLLDPSCVHSSLSRKLFERLPAGRSLVVLNKVDTLPREKVDEYAQSIHLNWGAHEVIGISALHHIGTEGLLTTLMERLPEGVPHYPQESYTEHPVRFLVLELIREQVFLQMAEEIPYATTIEIEVFQEPAPDDPLTRIQAAIIVEKEGQKPMMIGKHGTRIKEIGIAARKAIEQLIGGKVYLELFVRVEEGWTRNEEKLHTFGYR